MATRLPRATPHWPLLGCVPSLLMNPKACMEDNQRRHGDIYTVSGLGQQVVIVNHPRHVEHIKLLNAGNYHTGKGNPMAQFIIPGAISTTDQEAWRLRRRLLQPYFTRAHMVRLFPRLLESIDTELDTWEGEHDLDKICSHLSMKVLIKTVFGASATSEEIERVRLALDYVVEYPIRIAVSHLMSSWWSRLGLPGAKHALSTFTEVIDDIIERHEPSTDEDQDVLSRLIMATEEHEDTLDRRWVVHQVLELILAGYETTSSTIAWLLVRLATDARVFDNVRREVDAGVGEGAWSLQRLRRLEYLQATASEVLRLYPAAYLFWSQCMADDVIDGYAVPQGHKVAISAYAVQRHPDAWEQPDHFVPERFVGATKLDKHAFVPFGIGHRQCLGQELALQEIHTTLARIVMRFDYTVDGATEDLSPRFGIALRPQNRIGIRLAPRQVAARHMSRADEDRWPQGLRSCVAVSPEARRSRRHRRS
ncbi:MAG: cytochrome P450 [Deltaproteobacteria bacterium]|nr:cytochrome P450 [Deltaproteobacteria bacterium]